MSVFLNFLGCQCQFSMIDALIPMSAAVAFAATTAPVTRNKAFSDCLLAVPKPMNQTDPEPPGAAE